MNYGYCVTSLYWNGNIGTAFCSIFKVAYPWKPSYGHYLRINKNSPHLNRFNRFLLDCFSTGLIMKWSSDMKMRNYTKKIQKFFDDSDTILRGRDFRLPATILVSGNIIAALTFGWELYRGRRVLGGLFTRIFYEFRALRYKIRNVILKMHD